MQIIDKDALLILQKKNIVLKILMGKKQLDIMLETKINSLIQLYMLVSKVQMVKIIN